MSQHHKYPRCPVTGKIRLGERKDVRLVLADIRRASTKAQLVGLSSVRRERRGYRCPHCSGWHLTSQASPWWSLAAGVPLAAL